MYPWEAESQAFRFGLRAGDCGSRGRYEHLKAFLSWFWPLDLCCPENLCCEECKAAGRVLHPLRWNPWTEATLREFCNDETAVFRGNLRTKVTVLSGAAACSKTWTSGMYAFAWWICAPFESTVMFTSTTKAQIKRRIWPVIGHFFDNSFDPSTGRPRTTWGFCKKTESRTSIDYISPAGTPSEKDAIFAMAVAEGETTKAAHNLRGLHNRRMLLVIDEMNGTPEAILETIPNQLKGCEDHQVICLGNPISHLDPHGQACKPVQGWSAVTEEKLSWPTMGVDKWELEPGICLRFDGKDSPNVKLGRDLWPFIFTIGNWARACDPRFEKTLMYWSQSRGLWPPEGQCRTILSETLLEKYDPEDGPMFRWVSRKRTIAFLDPAFGGDDCMLYFAELGDVEDGKEALQIVHAMALTFEQAAKDERDYIVARQTIEECKLRGVRPEDFGLDRTGTGRGVAAIISAEWSSSIHQVEFGQLATDRPSSTADNRPSREIYATFVTEMWWSVREFLEAGQLRGIPTQARVELTTREYDLTGRRYKLETKEDFKSRFNFSPDDGDCVAGLVEVARKHGVGAQTGAAKATDTVWEELVQKQVQESEEGQKPEPELFEEALEGEVWEDLDMNPS
jgi:hypothetical protein